MKRYYAVVYLKNGDSCVSRPCDTEEQAIDALKKVIAREPHNIKATTYMVREDAGEFIFGHPKSRDLIQDRKFMKSLIQ